MDVDRSWLQVGGGSALIFTYTEPDEDIHTHTHTHKQANIVSLKKENHLNKTGKHWNIVNNTNFIFNFCIN